MHAAGEGNARWRCALAAGVAHRISAQLLATFSATAASEMSAGAASLPWDCRWRLSSADQICRRSTE
jgi:hypothetical protein